MVFDSIWRIRSRVTPYTFADLVERARLPSVRPNASTTPAFAPGERLQHGVQLILQQGEGHRIGRDDGLGVPIKPPNWLSPSRRAVWSSEIGSGVRAGPDDLLRVMSILGEPSGGAHGPGPAAVRAGRGELVDDLTMCTGMRMVRAWSAIAGDGLADPPGGVVVENLEALGVVELLHRARIRPRLPSWIRSRERHAAAGVALHSETTTSGGWPPQMVLPWPGRRHGIHCRSRRCCHRQLLAHSSVRCSSGWRTGRPRCAWPVPPHSSALRRA